jgi:hypothetical protein
MGVVRTPVVCVDMAASLSIAHRSAAGRCSARTTRIGDLADSK